MASNGNGINRFIKIGGFAMGILAVVVSVVIWVTSAFADQKDWAAEQDRIVEERVKTNQAEQYVPKHRFTPVEQNIKDIKESLKSIDEKIDNLQHRGDDV